MTPYLHVRKEDLHEGSASVRNPAFASFDVVHRRDYDALTNRMYERALRLSELHLALGALLEHAERIQEHVPKSKNWYAVRDCARLELSEIGGGSSASDAATRDSGALRTVPIPEFSTLARSIREALEINDEGVPTALVWIRPDVAEKLIHAGLAVRVAPPDDGAGRSPGEPCPRSPLPDVCPHCHVERKGPL